MEGINQLPRVSRAPSVSPAHANPTLAALLCGLLRVIRYAPHRDAFAAALRFRQLLLLFRVAGHLDATQASRLSALVDNALYRGTRSPSVKDR